MYQTIQAVEILMLAMEEIAEQSGRSLDAPSIFKAIDDSEKYLSEKVNSEERQ